MREPKVQKMIEMSQSRLVRYVFNYNVLEAVSIAISTTILLAGMVGGSLPPPPPPPHPTPPHPGCYHHAASRVRGAWSFFCPSNPPSLPVD